MRGSTVWDPPECSGELIQDAPALVGLPRTFANGEVAVPHRLLYRLRREAASAGVAYLRPIGQKRAPRLCGLYSTCVPIDGRGRGGESDAGPCPVPQRCPPGRPARLTHDRPLPRGHRHALASCHVTAERAHHRRGHSLFTIYVTPRRQIDLADVWPAALTTALLWELTRRIIAFYLAQNDMISGYGPIGAATALLFRVYISSIIILLGAELGYAIAKERRRIPPAKEMMVVAALGEQPTPKFAPQTGRGFDNPDEREPILGV